MMSVALLLVLLGGCRAPVETVAPQVSTTSVAPTEAQALTLLLREAAAEAAAEAVAAAAGCGAGPVLLRVFPEHAPLALRQVFAEELMARGVAVRTAGETSACVMNVEARGMISSTVSSGNSSYFRKIEATIGILLEEGNGTVVYSRERQLARVDTLAGESPGGTRSLLDETPSWWESWLEPALVTATAAVIAVLLFTVRGSS